MELLGGQDCRALRAKLPGSSDSEWEFECRWPGLGNESFRVGTIVPPWNNLGYELENWTASPGCVSLKSRSYHRVTSPRHIIQVTFIIGPGLSPVSGCRGRQCRVGPQAQARAAAIMMRRGGDSNSMSYSLASSDSSCSFGNQCKRINFNILKSEPH